tara:strand:+ start:382 stop:681 length:300 start_codon:yes stop_codon:yes gene_type:complete
LQNYLKKIAERHGVLFFKLEAVGQTGFPDVLLAYKGWSVYVELKSEKGTGVLSKRQVFMLDKLSNNGLEVHVIKNTEACDKIIAHLINRESKPRYWEAV